jgi:hypothetical protein
MAPLYYDGCNNNCIDTAVYGIPEISAYLFLMAQNMMNLSKAMQRRDGYWRLDGLKCHPLHILAVLLILFLHDIRE